MREDIFILEINLAYALQFGEYRPRNRDPTRSSRIQEQNERETVLLWGRKI